MSSKSWPFLYAISSIKIHGIRNLGIVLLLSIGVAMPTVVFIWSATGTKLAVYDYFENNAYQCLVQDSNSLTNTELDILFDTAESNVFVDAVHNIPSTVGLLTAHENMSVLDWNYYQMYDVNYRIGIKDFRIFPLTSDMITTWSGEFEVQGNFSLEPGEVLVSEGFISYTEEVHGIKLELGMNIDFDILGNVGPRDSLGGSPRQLGKISINQHTIVGIYKIKNQRSLLGSVFPSIMRQNWIPGLPIYCESVLGIVDSIILLQDELSQSDVANILSNGFFDSQVLIRGSADALLEAGPHSAPGNLRAVLEQLQERSPETRIIGLRYIEKLESHIKGYLQSQAFLIMSFPMILMSIVLTLYISNLAIKNRSEELSVLRSKGASYNQVILFLLFESIILSFLGLVAGILIAIIMTPLMGSTYALFSIDVINYMKYLVNTEIPSAGIITAFAVAIYLPGVYLFHIQKDIAILEIKSERDEESYLLGTNIKKEDLIFGFIVSLVISLVIPIFITITSQNAIQLLIVITILFFALAYLSSRILREIMAHFIGKISLILGQKCLYVNCSLRKRGGQIKVLLALLTLTLFATNMMIIQSATYDMALESELKYAIGADMRVECDEAELDFLDNVLSDVGAFHSMPIVETMGIIGSEMLHLEGVRASSYLWISDFSEEDFINGNPQSILLNLSDTPNGIIISEFHSNLWRKSIGENLTFTICTDGIRAKALFNIVGIMRRAPGFGEASTYKLKQLSLACQLGFQTSMGGFALVNLDFLRTRFNINKTNLFFVKVPFKREISLMIDVLNELHTDIYSPYTFAIQDSLPSISLFKMGFQGLTVIGFIFSLVMSLITIVLLLEPAIFERESEYAIFRALGATKKNLLSLILSEFASVFMVIAAVSLSFGVLFGYSMALLTLGVSPYEPVLVHAPIFPFSLIFTLIASQTLIILIGCYLPARKISRIDPAVLLRNL